MRIGVLYVLDPANAVDELSEDNNRGVSPVPVTVFASGGARIQTESLPLAIVGEPYRAQLSAVGVDGPWRLKAGVWPNGLRLRSTEGTVEGVPEQVGRSTVTVGIEDLERR